MKPATLSWLTRLKKTNESRRDELTGRSRCFRIDITGGTSR
jgi:hypothetical protein